MNDMEKAPAATPQGNPSPGQHNRNAYLIGYRGTGKSTVARLLAQQLDFFMIDIDDLLESRAGRSIRTVFEQEGEIGFRQWEGTILLEVSLMCGTIVATGGGIVLRPMNRRLLRLSGRVAWLTADTATIWQRMQEDATTWDRRPNLTVGGPKEIDELLRVREPLYRECADCTVETTGRSPEEVAAQVRAGLNLG